MIDVRHLQQWIGRTEEKEDLISAAPVMALAATLDRDEDYPRHGDAVPALGHWLFFLPMARQSEIDRDGHAKRGGFLPPIPLPRRMFAGSRIDFHAPLRIGEPSRRVSEIANVSKKDGRSGTLVFVLLRHRIFGPDGLKVTEEQDIVYRDEAPAAAAGQSRSAPAKAPAAPAPAAAWSRTVHADPVMLFRFSALTFNGHRIHYDRSYAIEVEGYPGLVVHGPLTAMLLIDLCRRERPNAVIRRFSFRAMRPLFDTAPFTVAGAPAADGCSARLWAQDAGGVVGMEADVQFAS